MGRARSTGRAVTRRADRGPVASPASRAAARAAEESDASVPDALPDAIEGLDRVIHERARLAIVSVLASAGELNFSELRSLTRLTDGNLSVHARVLEEAGYLKVRKGYQGRRPRTTYALTARGLTAVRGYVAALEQIVTSVRPGPRGSGADGGSVR